MAPPDTDSILLYTKLLAITSGIVSAPKSDFFLCHLFLEVPYPQPTCSLSRQEARDWGLGQ